MQGHEWYPAEPHQANAWLRHFPAPWWVAGGWAIELFLEQTTREHEDLDVGVLRHDVPALQGALPAWQFFEAKDGQLTELKRDALPRANVHSLWCRRQGSSVWELEVMLEQVTGDEWVYRRQPMIRRPLTTVLLHSKCGLRYLAPEVQLLYKSKHVRHRDDADLRSALPRLSKAARDWLRNALVVTEPDHAWVGEIDRASLVG